MTYTLNIFGRNVFHFTIHNIMSLKYCDFVPVKSELNIEKISLHNVDQLKEGFISYKLIMRYLAPLHLEYANGFLFKDDCGNNIGYVWVFKKGANEVQYKIRGIDLYISDVFVYPQFRGNQYAKKMLSILIDNLYKEGYSSYHLACRTDNYNALHIYESMNFKIEKKKIFIRILGCNFPYHIL